LVRSDTKNAIFIGFSAGGGWTTGTSTAGAWVAGAGVAAGAQAVNMRLRVISDIKIVNNFFFI
jgi:hypothetical protein